MLDHLIVDWHDQMNSSSTDDSEDPVANQTDS